MVFDAEKQVAKSGTYHKKCFTCIKCKHQLGAGDFTNGPDNEIYCVYCYRVNCRILKFVKPDRIRRFVVLVYDLMSSLQVSDHFKTVKMNQCTTQFFVCVNVDFS